MADASDATHGVQYSHTCIACRVIFARAELQREHYKSDWHRYNLKRKVAELAPVTAEIFQKKVLAHREEAAALELEANAQTRCLICNKNFNNVRSFDNHLNSKKHKELEAKKFKDKEQDAAKLSADEDVPTEKLRNEVQNIKTKTEILSRSPEMVRPLPDSPRLVLDRKNADIRSGATEDADRMVSDQDDGDDDDDDDDEWDEDAGLGLEECLFCNHVSPSMDGSIEHMYLKHGFFVPDLDYCTDVVGLLTYLGQKVGVGFVCLWCNERSRSFVTLDAVQKHMRDKCHCKLAHDGDAMLEYAEYYDYSPSYPDENVSPSDSEIVVPSILEDQHWQLVLPSGSTVGHRSLKRYYRQNLKPEKRIVARGKGINSSSQIMQQYRALGWTGTTDRKVAEMRAKDIQFMKKIQARQQLRLGIKHNKFQPHFRRDDFDH